MTWWQFWKKKDPLETDIFIFANLPIYKFLQKEEPYTAWRSPNVDLPTDLESLVRLWVNGYQLITFLKLVDQRFGPEIARIVREYQIVTLNRIDNIGDEFAKLFKIIDDALNSDPIKVPTSQGEVEVPGELKVALALLVKTIGSPSCYSGEGNVPKIPDGLDFNVAECLEYGKQQAFPVFSRIVANVKLKPASVPGLRQDRPLSWSSDPGCFERHLQRKYNYPQLFPLKQPITQSDIDAARMRDEADINRLQLVFRELIAEQAIQLPAEATSHDVNQLRQEIDNLLHSIAEVGGMAASELVSKAHTLRQALVSDWGNAIASNPEAMDLLKRAESVQNQEAAIFNNWFVAQMGRKDTPIQSDEVVRALLTESADTIRITMQAVDENLRAHIRNAVSETLNDLKARSESIPDEHEKLLALGMRGD